MQTTVSDDRVEEMKYWTNRWQENNITFHQENVHISLEKNLEKLIAGRKEIKVLFPLCGKCVDMKLLADKGHYIIGVDVAEQALENFFTENNLEHTVEELADNKGKLFKSKDGKIKLYCMDFFEFTKDFEGQVNAVWDRGALVAINPKTRTRYTQTIKQLLAPDCHYMIATMQYDPSLYPGPPYNVTKEDVEDLYSDVCSIEFVEENDYSYKFVDRGLKEICERVYLLKVK
ncbi:probable thiopurine S-methyltransferase [Argonauta hians]